MKKHKSKFLLCHPEPSSEVVEIYIAAKELHIVKLLIILNGSLRRFRKRTLLWMKEMRKALHWIEEFCHAAKAAYHGFGSIALLATTRETPLSKI